MASTMQLEFSQAMSDFKKMFPDMEGDVIEVIFRPIHGHMYLIFFKILHDQAVLRANSGAVDATIDQLLSMSTDNQNEKLRNELDSSGTPERKVGKVAATANLLNLDENRQRTSPTTGASPKIRKPTSPRKNKKWDPPLLGPLPPTFLRIAIPGSSEFNLDDEQFALMLQNEEFMNELRWNQVNVKISGFC